MSELRYRPINTPCDLCIVALEQCIYMGLPASWQFTLHVGVQLATGARGIIRHLIHKTADNPFVPQLNLVIENDLAPNEWYVESNGVAIGSNPYP